MGDLAIDKMGVFDLERDQTGPIRFVNGVADLNGTLAEGQISASDRVQIGGRDVRWFGLWTASQMPRLMVTRLISA